MPPGAVLQEADVKSEKDGKNPESIPRNIGFPVDYGNDDLIAYLRNCRTGTIRIILPTSRNRRERVVPRSSDQVYGFISSRQVTNYLRRTDPKRLRTILKSLISEWEQEIGKRKERA